MKEITKIIEEQEVRFLGMLLGTLGDSLLGNILTEKGMLRTCYGQKKENEC